MPGCIRYRHKDLAPSVMVFGSHWVLNTHISGSHRSTVHRYISNILRPVILPYIRGLLNAIFQLDNAKLDVAPRFLTFIDTQVIDFSSGLYGLQISQPLKTSGDGLLRD